MISDKYAVEVLHSYLAGDTWKEALDYALTIEATLALTLVVGLRKLKQQRAGQLRSHGAHRKPCPRPLL